MATTKLMTAEDLSQLKDDEHRYDLIRGELIRMSPASARHGKLALRIGRKVASFADDHKLGDTYAAETGFLLARNPDIVLAPDAAFVRSDRLPPEEEQDRFLELAPDLVVEVASPSDRWTEVNEKVTIYLNVGVSLVWIVDPKTQRITIYTPDRSPLTVTVDEDLDGGEVLPGFRVPVAEIFAE